MEDYNGYSWGWIDIEGTRFKAGIETKIPVDRIAGVWGKCFRSDIANGTYLETFLTDYREDINQKGNIWSLRPLACIQKINREQCLAYAYPEETSHTDVYVFTPIVAQSKPILTKCLWKCGKCGHTFYGLALSIYERFIYWLTTKKIKCDACHEKAAGYEGSFLFNK